MSAVVWLPEILDMYLKDATNKINSCLFKIRWQELVANELSSDIFLPFIKESRVTLDLFNNPDPVLQADTGSTAAL